MSNIEHELVFTICQLLDILKEDSIDKEKVASLRQNLEISLEIIKMDEQL